jgi:hypothetical protein
VACDIPTRNFISTVGRPSSGSSKPRAPKNWCSVVRVAFAKPTLGSSGTFLQPQTGRDGLEEPFCFPSTFNSVNYPQQNRFLL